MYRRGRYYRARRRFPLLPREAAVLAVAVVLAGVVITVSHSGEMPRQLTDRVLAARANHNDDTEDIEDPQKAAVTAGNIIGGALAPSTPLPTTSTDLSAPDKKEIAMRLVSSAENSSLDWRAQFAYIEDIGDGRGYTAGIIGFCSGTGDMLQLVEAYTKAKPGNVLAPFLPALRHVNGTASHAGLGAAFVAAWKQAAADPVFQQAQEGIRDEVYFKPALALAKADGLGVLGQFVYYDAAVMHGPDAWGGGLPDLRARVPAAIKSPAQGGDEKTYLEAFLAVRKAEMSKEAAHRNVSRIDDAQLAFLRSGNLSLSLPLAWKMYGDSFDIANL